MQLLDVETASARLAMHPETLRKMIRAGEFPALKLGRFWKVEESEVENYVERLKATQNK
jgi:excisionase family DNA binding protein